jgi:hypothetical protein
MYNDQEAAQLYREMTDGSTRPKRIAPTPNLDLKFVEFFRNAFEIIDEMEAQ